MYETATLTCQHQKKQVGVSAHKVFQLSWLALCEAGKEKSAAVDETEKWRLTARGMGLELGGESPLQHWLLLLQWKGLTRDSKVNPDVLLLLISLADEWEGKITGASQGGPVCCPATQALPSSPPQLQQPQQIRVRPPVGRGRLKAFM